MLTMLLSLTLTAAQPPVIELKLHEPCEIEFDATLFVNDHGLRKVPIYIAAIAVAKSETTDVSPMP